jgi:NAD(P)-dependent dehydrogenase (short-subunit alcohol dehydrogenase family)
MTQSIALITGGSRGLGRSAALHLAKAGVHIILTYQSDAAAASVVVREIEQGGGRAAAIQLDVADSAGFAQFAASVKEVLAGQWQRTHFDFLVNNAGAGVHAGFVQTTEDELDRMFRIHLKGPFLLTQHLLPLVSDGGRIVNISSGLTRFALPGYAAYASMKGGLEVLTRYMAKELGERGIAVNTLAPGAIETDFGGGMVRDNAALNAGIASQTALGRVGLPDDIGGAIAALLGEGSRWINAQRVEVSGGIAI